MADTKKYFSRNNIYDIIEIFEDFLEKYDVRIPESDEEMLESYDSIEENSARIYGSVCDDLENDLLDYFEMLEENGTIPNVVNSWDDEIEGWGEE